MKKSIMILVAACSMGVAVAQTGKTSEKPVQANEVTAETYSCPMHPEVTADKPGDCSKCGMKLVAQKKEAKQEKMAKSYSCPMHPEVKSEKAGKCSKCGMALVKEEEKKMEKDMDMHKGHEHE